MVTARAGAETVDLWKSLEVDFRQIGRTGLKVSFLGAVDEELHPKLSGQRAAGVYRQMADNDPTINAFMLAVDGIIRRVPWYVRPAKTKVRSIVPRSKGAAAQRQAEHLRTCMHDMSMSWRNVISSTLSMLVFGYAPLEIVYKMRMGLDQASPKYRSKHDDGRIGWRLLAPRAQETIVGWDYDDEGGVRAMKQTTDTVRLATIPIEKLLLFRIRADKLSPEGRSLLKGLHRSWFFRTSLEEIEAVGAERDLVGYPYMEVPKQLLSDTASADDKALAKKLWKLLVQTRRNHREGALIPSEWNEDGTTRSGFKLGLLQSGGARAFDVDVPIKRHRTDMATALLFGFSLLGMDARGGGRALGGPLIRFFMNSIEYIVDEIMDVLVQFGIPRLMMLDGVPPELWPTVAHGSVHRFDAHEAADVLRLLGGIGGQDVLQRTATEVAASLDLGDPSELLAVEEDEPGKAPVKGGRPTERPIQDGPPSRAPADPNRP